MAKSITVQRKIFKIESKDIRYFTHIKLRRENKKSQNKKNNTIKNSCWEYEINLYDEIARDTNRVIALGESTTLRFLDQIMNRNKNIKQDYDNIKRAIAFKKQNEILPIELRQYNNKDIKQLYQEILNMQFQKNYIMIVFNRKSDFKDINKNGLKINGECYKRLYGTSGSIKNNTVIYVCNEKLKEDDNQTIYETLLKRLENNVNKNIKVIPSKYESYLSLCSSASTPVLKNIQPENVLIVNDHILNFKTKATLIHKCVGDKTNIENVDEYNMELVQSDGCGVCDIETAKQITEELGEKGIASGFVIRHSYVKGALFPFDIHAFQQQYGKKDYIIDIWGNSVKFSNVKIILPASVMKLWYCYESIQDYFKQSKINGHTFAVTKIMGKSESERTANYQFLSSLNLNSKEIYQLVYPTIKEIHDVLGNDFRKAILYSKGKYINEANVEKLDADFLKALMIDQRMMNDPHVRKGLYKMMKSAINRAKIGKIKLHGNFSIISGDMFAFLQHVFDLKDTSGLLTKSEFYSGYWNKQGVTQVLAMRAPMCTHANYRILNFKRNKELDYWYQYMQDCIVFNCHDSTAESLSGADKDGDCIMTTDNTYMLKGVKKLPPIICPMKGCQKEIVTESKLEEANLNGFNNNVGKDTNKATCIRNKMASFNIDSKEYKELEKREMAIQRIQQSVIDSIKNGFAEKIPRSWYNEKENVIINEAYINKLKRQGIAEKDLPCPDNAITIQNKKFNQKILASKKPYFFIYIYENLNKQCKEYEKCFNDNCIRYCGKKIKDLIKKKRPSQQDKYLIKMYYNNYPVDLSPSLMNQICNIFEQEFDRYFSKIKPNKKFDYSFMKKGIKYDKKVYRKINKLYSNYKKSIKKVMIKDKVERIDNNLNAKKREIFKEKFQIDALNICKNEKILCDIVLDMTYGNNKNPQFAWDICGNRIIKNLLDINNHEIIYFEKDKNGVVKFDGERFTMRKKKVSGDFCQ